MTIQINDKAYWSQFYANQDQVPKKPSMFAEFLLTSNYIKENQNILELGCGNGRDSIYFAKNNLNVIAIDQCENTTKILNDINNITSYSADFTRLETMQDKDLDIIYSRFTMHSIDENGENDTLKWVFSNLKAGGLFCIEARTTKDPLCYKGIDKGNNIWFHDNHHRRFIEADVFKGKLLQLGFEILFFEEDNGFATYKTEDPIVLRCVVKKA
ncbi:MAG: class I SAM-dependent methyltransferase [Flavobacteriales bacterium]